MRPWEYSRLSHKDYILLCIGHKEKLLKEEYAERRLNYNIVQGYATKESLPPMHIWWPIGGEKIPKVKLPTQRQLKKHDDIFRSLGKKK